MRVQRLAPIIAFFWTIALGFFNVFGPVFASASTASSIDKYGNEVVTMFPRSYASGLEVDGARIVYAVMIPILLTILPLVAHRRILQVVFGSMLLVFCLISAASIGLLYLPAAILLIASGRHKQESPRPDSASYPHA
jgi:hypothetical protein